MNAMRARVTPWLLLLPALTLLVAFTHWPALATVWDSFLSTPKKGRPAHFIGLDNYRGMVEDEVFWQALANNVIYARRHDPALDRAGDRDGALGQQPPRRPRLPAPGVLHADGAADDRGRQHLALLLHAAVRPARADHAGARPAEPQLARRQAHRARRDHRRRGLEGGRLLHDLLPRRAAADPAARSPRRRRSRARRARSTSAASSSRCSCRRRSSSSSTR